MRNSGTARGKRPALAEKSGRDPELPLTRGLQLVAREHRANGIHTFLTVEEVQSLVVSVRRASSPLAQRIAVPKYDLPATLLARERQPEVQRILLVENQPELARAVKRVLEREGFEITICKSCAEAEAIAGEFHSGIFDLSLPDGDGLALAERLKEQIKNRVFYSATRDTRKILEAEKLGCFVSKVAGVNSLRHALALVLPEHPIPISAARHAEHKP